MTTIYENDKELDQGFFDKAIKTKATTGQGIANEVRQAAVAKVSTTIRLPAEVLAYFQAGGKGWQTRISDTLADYVKEHRQDDAA